MKRMVLIFLLLFGLLQPISQSAVAVTHKTVTFRAEVWADNWFALYVNGRKVGEDSVSIKTERSFNSEVITFKASYPLTIGVMAKDYVENASGLEYIGKPNQQIGDAGIAFQISETSTGKLVDYSNSTWKVLVIDKAPLNQECVSSPDPLQDCKRKNISIPKSWMAASYKDGAWKAANQFSQEEVGVKEGYFDILWNEKTKLIWSSDLKLDNTILLRKKVLVPSEIVQKSSSLRLMSDDFTEGGSFPVEYTCDGTGVSPPLRWSGAPSNTKSFVIVMDSIPGPLRPGEVNSEKHYYLILYNIPPSTSAITKSTSGLGTVGQNFLGKTIGYTPPCSQGPGAKKYTFTLYALSSLLALEQSDATLTNLEPLLTGKVLAKAQLNVLYSRTDSPK